MSQETQLQRPKSTVALYVRLDTELVDEFEARAGAEGLSKTDAVAAALRLWLASPPPAPSAAAEPRAAFSTRLRVQDLERLEELSRDLGLSKQAVIDEALADWIAKHS